ncbi:MAG: DNA replication/repair protein RecF [Acidimicrobiales bacterium]
MHLRKLWLTDFRNYERAALDLAPGLTAVVGDNGQGKSNLIEAIGYLATLSSFRGAPTEALVRSGSDRAIVRAEGERGGRHLLIEAEIVANGRSRVLVNRQRLVRSRDLVGALRVTVFAPDDLVLVKGGPAERRRYLDDALVSLKARNDLLRSDYERIVRQRNALLKQAAGRLTPEIATTLDVWDTKLVECGEALAGERVRLLEALRPHLSAAYSQVAGTPTEVTATYVAPWRDGGLAAALEMVRKDELRRGVSLVGPHRDDVELRIGGLPARTHASQGEQRCLALALRLAAHAVVAGSAGSPPLLLLDDVFSELDPGRSDALLRALPTGQTVLTTASSLPRGTRPERVLRVERGVVLEDPDALQAKA